MSAPQEPPQPLSPVQRFKEYEDPHYHDEDDLGSVAADDAAPHRPAPARPAKPKPRIIPSRRRFAPED